MYLHRPSTCNEMTTVQCCCDFAIGEQCSVYKSDSNASILYFFTFFRELWRLRKLQHLLMRIKLPSSARYILDRKPNRFLTSCIINASQLANPPPSFKLHFFKEVSVLRRGQSCECIEINARWGRRSRISKYFWPFHIVAFIPPHRWIQKTTGTTPIIFTFIILSQIKTMATKSLSLFKQYRLDVFYKCQKVCSWFFHDQKILSNPGIQVFYMTG